MLAMNGIMQYGSKFWLSAPVISLFFNEITHKNSQAESIHFAIFWVSFKWNMLPLASQWLDKVK